MKRLIKGRVMQMAVVIAAVSVLGLITVILGVAGASAASSVSTDSNGLLCEYSATGGVGLGIVALLFALMTQIVATAITSCCGCCRRWGFPVDGKRITVVVLSTVSWMLTIIVLILFIFGAIGSTARQEFASSDGKCDRSSMAALFASATVLFLIAVVSQIISYILLEMMAAKSPPEEQSGIPMGQPAPANGSAPPAPVPAQPEATTPPPPAPAVVPSEGSAADPTNQV